MLRLRILPVFSYLKKYLKILPRNTPAFTEEIQRHLATLGLWTDIFGPICTTTIAHIHYQQSVTRKQLQLLSHKGTCSCG